MMTWLSACSFFTPTVKVKVETDCIWFEDQTMTELTKDWLTREPWPDYVREDFDKIGDNNDLFKRHCSN